MRQNLSAKKKKFFFNWYEYKLSYNFFRQLKIINICPKKPVYFMMWKKIILPVTVPYLHASVECELNIFEFNFPTVQQFYSRKYHDNQPPNIIKRVNQSATLMTI